MSLSISVNGATRVVEKIDGLEKLFANPRPALEDIGDLIVSETDKQFETSGSRFGKKWKKLKRATQIQKAKLGYGSKGILERTGELRYGFKKDVARYKVTVSNPITYYKYHQLGMGYNPKRVMLDAPEKVKQDIIEILNKAIRGIIA